MNPSVHPQEKTCRRLVRHAFLLLLVSAWCAVLAGRSEAAQFDAAPFGLPLPEGNGLMWEDPREVHQVVVHFEKPVTSPESLRLEYWGSRWPQQHLPKDKEPGGGSVGWMELGNWYNGGWRKADTEAKAQDSNVIFTFRPVNAKEFPKVSDYPATFRYTLKLRVTSDDTLPRINKIEAFTDSALEGRRVRLVFEEGSSRPELEVFNGKTIELEKAGTRSFVAELSVVKNPDPNTFDRTLVTVRRGKESFTFSVDDLEKGPLFLQVFGAAILPESDMRDYAAVAAEIEGKGGATLYERVKELPEQTWNSAWEGMPAKKSRIYLPLGLDGGRQRFQLEANGGIRLRSNDHYLKARPGKDTERLELEPGDIRFEFGFDSNPKDRSLDENSLPVCRTTWVREGLQWTQTAFVTELGGTKADGGVPAPDSTAIFMAELVVTNTSSEPQQAVLPLRYRGGDQLRHLESKQNGLLQLGEHVRGQIAGNSTKSEGDELRWTATVAPGETATVIVKLPYLVLTTAEETKQLESLDFERERQAVRGYWRRRMNESARLMTPEPVLDQFYRSHARHLLVNCELEPGAARRFARVGSFSYGAYGNESCMMVVDLERRGLHREAQQCLDAWLHYEGSVKLPGDFETQEGIFYGAGGYEAGGYNQHHGWILWAMAEHYRFTRDRDWLQKAAPGILKGADWIIRETRRTADRHPLERGLLPAGSLEDIGDWWTWLSTSCYTWRGLDAAAWALEQLQHPEAARIRGEATAYHKNLLANFRRAAERSPVVRLRDGTAVPKFPSHVHRRGRSFGWICETLEGSLHLLITGALKPDDRAAEWILKDYEDNLYLSNQYGYTLEDFDKHWFGRGGMSMQACLLLDAEPYLYRDDIKNALRAIFNGIAVSHFPDVHLNTEHALPNMGDWAGDHFKSSDEANATGWLRYLFVREQGNELLLGQGVPRGWLAEGKRCGMDRAATYFGPLTLTYQGGDNSILARLDGPNRNPPDKIRLRFRTPGEQPLRSVTVDGKPWKDVAGDWVILPGGIGRAEVQVNY